jgi:hypothetical protein
MSHVPESAAPCCEGGVVESSVTTRRDFLFSTLARGAGGLVSLGGISTLIGGCATAGSKTALPGPIWRTRTLPTADDGVLATTPLPAPGTPAGILARMRWAGGQPVPALMNRMLPVTAITVHHDGMDPFFGNDQSSAAARLEAIRRAHREKGWGDIGYHFAVDREGRVWECRPLLWQGAHVKDQNEGNIGVLTLGNFDRQSPTAPQLSSLNKCVSWLMNRYKVPLRRVFTHQEWPTARTACPGMSLQRYMVAVRTSRQLG